LAENGDAYDTLGYINFVLTNYQESVDAFQAALDKGDLSSPADTLLFLARALVELDEFDAAIDATKRSAEAGDSGDRENANTYERFVTDTQRIHNTLDERRQVVIDFYESYPALF
jgi:tetratricopeptide (TPR) repeat protein